MSMFWGLNMKPERKYSQTIIKSFHISGVALDKGQEAKLYLAAEKQEYIVATVTKAIPQVALDLNFSKGDRIMFYTAGDASVSLLGYLHDIDSDEDEEDDDEFTIEKFLKEQGKNKKSKTDNNDESGEEEEEDEDEDEEDGDDKLIGEYESFLENGEDEEDDSEEEEDEESGDEDSEDSEAEEEQPKAKIAKLTATAAKKTAKEQNGVAKKEEAKQQQKKEKNEVKKEQPKAKQQPATGESRSLAGGVKIVDVLPGKGEEAKPGKRVSVYYTGRLQSNNKTFDSLLKGKPFKFSLGGGEVIKGWDVGVAGMKVGGKRRITCPPHMGYGSRGAPPKIGPNSTLVFDVELKAVH